jgi:hypothetical protein
MVSVLISLPTFTVNDPVPTEVEFLSAKDPDASD